MKHDLIFFDRYTKIIIVQDNIPPDAQVSPLLVCSLFHGFSAIEPFRVRGFGPHAANFPSLLHLYLAQIPFAAE